MSGIRTNAITEKQNHKYKPLQRQQPLHHMYLLKVPPAWLYICPDATVGFPQLHLEICPDTRLGVLPFQSNFCPDPWLTLPYIIRGPQMALLNEPIIRSDRSYNLSFNPISRIGWIKFQL